MLQYNIPADEISRTLRNQKYEPSGFVSRHPYIKSASSISDLISKVIDIELGDFTRCQVKPKKFARVYSEEVNLEEEALKKDLKTGEKVYGETCSKCGGDNLLRNGTCKICQDCGTTTGCS
jgi:ribonucleoside-diphosphate reductase alpha chain